MSLFSCQMCNYMTNRQYNYNKHLKTKKHLTQLKKYGVEMIPFDFRHKYFWDSGLHCVTLDLSRNGERESYV